MPRNESLSACRGRPSRMPSVSGGKTEDGTRDGTGRVLAVSGPTRPPRLDLQHPLAGQLELACGLTGLEPALGCAEAVAFAHLELVLVGREGARAVMGEMNTSCQAVSSRPSSPHDADTSGCACCLTHPAGHQQDASLTQRIGAQVVLAGVVVEVLLVQARVARDVLVPLLLPGALLLLLLRPAVAAAAAAEHLVEEAELGGRGREEAKEDEGEQGLHGGRTGGGDHEEWQQESRVGFARIEEARWREKATEVRAQLWVLVVAKRSVGPQKLPFDDGVGVRLPTLSRCAEGCLSLSRGGLR